MSATQYESADSTRAQILKAATLIFAQMGFGGASMEKIAKEAGVNKALLYYHYGDKITLYNAIFQEAAACVKSHLPQESKPEERFAHVAMQLSSNPDFSRLLLQELGAGGVHLEESTRQTIRATLSKIISNGDLALSQVGILGGIHFLNVAAPLLYAMGLVPEASDPLPVRFVRDLTPLFKNKES